MAKHIIKKRARHGFTFRYPSGELDYRITETMGAAWTNAAFACERPHSHIVIPLDWQRAEEQGFRIVHATLKSRGPAIEKE